MGHMGLTLWALTATTKRRLKNHDRFDNRTSKQIDVCESHALYKIITTYHLSSCFITPLPVLVTPLYPIHGNHRKADSSLMALMDLMSPEPEARSILKSEHVCSLNQCSENFWC